MKNATEKRSDDTLNLQTYLWSDYVVSYKSKRDDFSYDSFDKFQHNGKLKRSLLGGRGGGMNVTRPSTHPQADILEFCYIPNSPRGRTPLLRPWQFTPEQSYNNGSWHF